MADGSKKPIKDVKLSDKVMALDPETGETGPRSVTGLIQHSGPHVMVEVRLKDGTAIHATEAHQFWVQERRFWVDAADLAPGDVLLGSNGGPAVVSSTWVTEDDLTAFNLTVEGLHTYFVGDESVLVHNDDYNQAMREALSWLEDRGFRAERPTIGRFGDIQGKPIGMQTADGRVGFRVEFDSRSGAHINVWSGKEKGPHFTFEGAEDRGQDPRALQVLMMSGDYWEAEVFGVVPLAGLERVQMDVVFDWIAKSLPAKGSKVDWSSVRGRHSHQRFVDADELLRHATREVLRRLQGSYGVDHVGDSLSPFGIHFAGGDAEAIVTALLEIPEHHYFVDGNRAWLVVVSSEGDLDTVDLPGSGVEREA